MKEITSELTIRVISFSLACKERARKMSQKKAKNDTKGEKLLPLKKPFYKVVVIGAAGHQAQEYINLMRDHWNICALVDPNFSTTECKDGIHHQNINSVNLLDIDFALICVPHSVHWEAAKFFLERNIPIIKEKPLAISLECLKKIKSYNNPTIFITTQRQFNPIFDWAYKMLPQLGTLYKFDYEYTLSIPEETQGWRGRFEFSQGGVVLDMGYHMFDVLIRFFGEPDAIYGNLSHCYESMRKSLLEDSAVLIYEVHKETRNLIGVVNINRHGCKKTEELRVYGEHGELIITPKKATILDRYGEQTYQMIQPTNVDFRIQMIQDYMENLNNKNYAKAHLAHHSKIVSCIDKIYKLTRR
jgi:predicted dehydrogenase